MAEPQLVTRRRLFEARMEGADAAKAGQTAAACPYSILDKAAERALAHAWIRGFTHARSILAKQRATQTP